MTFDEQMASVGFAILGFVGVRVLRDIKGVSVKINKVLGLLYEWDGLDDKQRRAELSKILKGR